MCEENSHRVPLFDASYRPRSSQDQWPAARPLRAVRPTPHRYNEVCAIMWDVEPAAYPVTEAFPRAAPALWPERLSADCSWSPWRSKWNHMGESDSGTWPEEKLTWAGISRPGSRMVATAEPAASSAYGHVRHSVTTRMQMSYVHAKWQAKQMLSPPLASCILHPLRGDSAAAVVLRSGRPIRSIYCRASRHANNTKHTNGRETKPQATDIQ